MLFVVFLAHIILLPGISARDDAGVGCYQLLAPDTDHGVNHVVVLIGVWGLTVAG